MSVGWLAGLIIAFGYAGFFLFIISLIEKCTVKLLCAAIAVVLTIATCFAIGYIENSTTLQIVESTQHKIHRVESIPFIVREEELVRIPELYADLDTICVDIHRDVDGSCFRLKDKEVYRKPGETVTKPTWKPVNNTISQTEYFNWSWDKEENVWVDNSTYEQEWPKYETKNTE